MTNKSSSPSLSSSNYSDTISTPSLSPSSWYEDDSSDIDELDHRSRKLNQLLKKNVDRANSRAKLIDFGRRKAWFLDDQIVQLGEQTKRIKTRLDRNSFKRRLIMFGAFMSSVILIGFGINHMSSDDRA